MSSTSDSKGSFAAIANAVAAAIFGILVGMLLTKIGWLWQVPIKAS